MNTATEQPAEDVEDLVELMDYSIDVEARDNGAWIKKNRVIPGLVFCALGYNSPKIEALQHALTKGRPEGYGEDEAVTTKRNLYENRKMAEAGILNWSPFALKGDRIEYSAEMKKKLFKDPSWRKVLLAAMDAMNQADVIKIKWEKAAEKNSGDGSGESSGKDATAEAA